MIEDLGTRARRAVGGGTHDRRGGADGTQQRPVDECAPAADDAPRAREAAAHAGRHRPCVLRRGRERSGHHRDPAETPAVDVHRRRRDSGRTRRKGVRAPLEPIVEGSEVAHGRLDGVHRRREPRLRGDGQHGERRDGCQRPRRQERALGPRSAARAHPAPPPSVAEALYGALTRPAVLARKGPELIRRKQAGGDEKNHPRHAIRKIP